MTIKEIRQQFYTFRNGIIADTLRKAGYPHRIIFGLNLPQITDIARLIGLDASLARELWADTSCREAQLLAPMIMPSDAIGQNDALKMIKECVCVETTDILCHKLLRRTSFAEPLCLQLFGISEHIYSALRLALNIVDNSSAEFRDALRNAIKPDDSDSNAIKGLKANLLERMA